MALHPMALAALLLFAGPADFPEGTIAAELGGEEWTIRFADDGKFTVSTDGEAVVEGKYEVTKDEIVLSDETGPRADRGNKPGKYTWKRDGKKMTFTKVEDEARGRVGALTSGAWTLKD